MILTVTLNPLLEHRLTYKALRIGNENRGAIEHYKAGGKGINVSRQLNLLSVDNLAFTFLGGNNGKMLKKLLAEEKINFTSITTNSESRASSILIDESKELITSCFGNDPVISDYEVDEFKSKLEKIIQNCEIVVFSGSSPCEATNSIFPFGIQAANLHDKISICDTYGTHLQSCIESSPTIVHNNIDEVEKSLSISLQSEKEITNHMKFLYAQNIKQSFLTDGANPTYASNLDFHYKINNPQIRTIDSTGSGDSFVAGIAYAWHRNLPFEDALSFASCLGVANATKYDVCNVTFDEAEQLKNKIKIVSIGKKMRTVDVNPG
jgi:1-phosphofructokinase family hexose kinase